MLSFFLNFFLIGQSGYGNAYYAAAIRSMTQSWYNFFYISFRPGGVVSVDKSAAGAVGAGAVRAAVRVPRQGHACGSRRPLAGALSQPDGVCADRANISASPRGLIAALTFALTPAVVVASRNNTMDMQLVARAAVRRVVLMRALETGRPQASLAVRADAGAGLQ
jgi:4-amino-4-deoxy-L-arabinose transferase-like glycosyltransferase